MKERAESRAAVKEVMRRKRVRDLAVPAMSEKQLQSSIVRAAKTFGWKVHFAWVSIHSPAGYPDLTLVKPPRVIFAELKSDSGKVTPEQQKWLDALGEVAERAGGGDLMHGLIEVYVWRPADLEDAYRILMGT